MTALAAQLSGVSDCSLYGHVDVLGEGVCSCGQVAHSPCSVARWERRTGQRNMLAVAGWVCEQFDGRCGRHTDKETPCPS